MSEQRYLDPKNDVAFKKLFEDKTRLMSFLNSVLHLKNDRSIIDLDYLPQEAAPLLPGYKKGIMDVRCKDQAGHQFLVEMQKDYVVEFLQRVQFYGAYAYVSQIAKGTPHLQLKDVVVLAVVNYTIFQDHDICVNFYEMRNRETHDNELNSISYAFIELPKFKKSKEECKTVEEEWIYTLKNAQEELTPPFKDEVLLDAYDILERYNWDQLAYESYLATKISTDEQAATQSEKYEKGLEDGLLKAAKMMLELGISIDVIVEKTGLSKKLLKNPLADLIGIDKGRYTTDEVMKLTRE